MPETKTLTLAEAENFLTKKIRTVYDFTSIDDEAAAKLAEYKEDYLNLSGLTNLSETAAGCLSAFKGKLDLGGLKNPDEAVILKLASEHKGELDLGGLERLSENSVKALARHRGDVSLSRSAYEDMEKHVALENNTTEEIFGILSSQFPDHEYLAFSWTGGGDDFHGFNLIEHKLAGQEEASNEAPDEWTHMLQCQIDGCPVFEDMLLDINCVDNKWSEGILLVALKRLPEDLYLEATVNYSDVSLSADKGFKGMRISGKNHEEIGDSLPI